jgi:hypothetical protein
MGRKYPGDWVGLGGVALFSLNPYAHKLVHGLTFAGFPDLFLVFFTSIALYLVLDWSQTRSVKSLRWLGLVIGLAYLCKGGLALAPFAVLAIIALAEGKLRDLFPVIQTVVIAIAIVFPEHVYLSHRYPVEFRYEQGEQLRHLTESIDGFGQPWHTYLTYFLPSVLNGLLVPFAYFSLASAFSLFRRGTPGFVLAVWSLAYIVPLSFGVSKVPNFIFPALPALALLIPYTVSRLLADGRLATLLALCITTAPTSVIWALTYRDVNLHWIPLAAAAICFSVTYSILLVRRRFASLTMTWAALAITAVTILGTYSYLDVWDNVRERPDSQLQDQIRQTASQIKASLTNDSLVLIGSEAEDRAIHVFLMYWSGVDAVDVCREPRPANDIARYRGWTNLYLLTGEKLPAEPVARVALGYLYSLDGIPFELWRPVATRPCSSASS